jgi:ech hydrogenase subunit A
LVAFHGVAKSLLFLIVGAVESRIFSKEIENMDGLLTRMPRLAWLFAIGIGTMFLAPFGVVLCKWAFLRDLALGKSFMTPVFLIMMAYGSAATLFYWGKLLGKVLTIIPDKTPTDFKGGDRSFESLGVLVTLGLGCIASCLFFPAVSRQFAQPAIQDMLGRVAQSPDNLLMLTALMTIVLLALPAMVLRHQYADTPSACDPYLSGRTSRMASQFNGALGHTTEATTRSYYLVRWFSESLWLQPGSVVASLVLAGLLIGSYLWR